MLQEEQKVNQICSAPQEKEFDQVISNSQQQMQQQSQQQMQQQQEFYSTTPQGENTEISQYDLANTTAYYAYYNYMYQQQMALYWSQLQNQPEVVAQQPSGGTLQIKQETISNKTSENPTDEIPPAKTKAGNEELEKEFKEYAVKAVAASIQQPQQKRENKTISLPPGTTTLMQRNIKQSQNESDSVTSPMQKTHKPIPLPPGMTKFPARLKEKDAPNCDSNQDNQTTAFKSLPSKQRQQQQQQHANVPLPPGMTKHTISKEDSNAQIANDNSSPKRNTNLAAGKEACLPQCKTNEDTFIAFQRNHGDTKNETNNNNDDMTTINKSEEQVVNTTNKQTLSLKDARAAVAAAAAACEKAEIKLQQEQLRLWKQQQQQQQQQITQHEEVSAKLVQDVEQARKTLDQAVRILASCKQEGESDDEKETISPEQRHSGKTKRRDGVNALINIPDEYLHCDAPMIGEWTTVDSSQSVFKGDAPAFAESIASDRQTIRVAKRKREDGEEDSAEEEEEEEEECCNADENGNEAQKESKDGNGAANQQAVDQPQQIKFRKAKAKRSIRPRE